LREYFCSGVASHLHFGSLRSIVIRVQTATKSRTFSTLATSVGSLVRFVSQLCFGLQEL
jgi:hypothetical protein